MKAIKRTGASALGAPRRLAGAALLGMLMLTASGALRAADPFKGKQLYNANCAVCHGPSGQGVMPGTPNFTRADALMRPDFTLLTAIRSGKNAMPAFQGILSDRDIMDVIAFMRTLH